MLYPPLNPIFTPSQIGIYIAVSSRKIWLIIVACIPESNNASRGILKLATETRDLWFCSICALHWYVDHWFIFLITLCRHWALSYLPIHTTSSRETIAKSIIGASEVPYSLLKDPWGPKIRRTFTNFRRGDKKRLNNLHNKKMKKKKAH